MTEWEEEYWFHEARKLFEKQNPKLAEQREQDEAEYLVWLKEREYNAYLEEQYEKYLEKHLEAEYNAMLEAKFIEEFGSWQSENQTQTKTSGTGQTDNGSN